jgi:hypothetical protein
MLFLRVLIHNAEQQVPRLCVSVARPLKRTVFLWVLANVAAWFLLFSAHYIFTPDGNVLVYVFVTKSYDCFGRPTFLSTIHFARALSFFFAL